MTFHADAATHDLCELAADRQPQPAAAELTGGGLIGLRKRLEDLGDGGSVHADAGVGDGQFRLAMSGPVMTTSALTTTAPWVVNLTALLTRFSTICRRRSGSPRSSNCACSGGHTISSMPLDSAVPVNKPVHSSMT